MGESRYSREVAAEVCRRMAEGESLRSICRDPDKPSEGTVRGWAVRDHDGFGERYRAARQLLLEAWADQIVDIADQADLNPRDRQVRCDTRKWLMSKLAPRRYGDRLLHAGDPDAPIQHVHQDISALLDQLSPQQLDDLVRFSQSLVDARQGGDG
jgi:hypothetical protein